MKAPTLFSTLTYNTHIHTIIIGITFQIEVLLIGKTFSIKKSSNLIFLSAITVMSQVSYDNKTLEKLNWKTSGFDKEFYEYRHNRSNKWQWNVVHEYCFFPLAEERFFHMWRVDDINFIWNVEH